MKNQNRVRAKNSAAKVPAQTQNQVEPGSKQYATELADARHCAAQYYGEWRLKKYGDAVLELAAFGCAIQYHPDLQPIVRALQEISFAEDSLDAFNCETKAMAGAGQRSALTDEERAARQWFSAFYKSIQNKTFLEAQLEYGGFYPWIKGSVNYTEVAAALACFLEAARVLEDFTQTVLYNEGMDATEGGAR